MRLCLTGAPSAGGDEVLGTCGATPPSREAPKGSLLPYGFYNLLWAELLTVFQKLYTWLRHNFPSAYGAQILLEAQINGEIGCLLQSWGAVLQKEKSLLGDLLGLSNASRNFQERMFTCNWDWLSHFLRTLSIRQYWSFLKCGHYVSFCRLLMFYLGGRWGRLQKIWRLLPRLSRQSPAPVAVATQLELGKRSTVCQLENMEILFSLHLTDIPMYCMY